MSTKVGFVMSFFFEISEVQAIFVRVADASFEP